MRLPDIYYTRQPMDGYYEPPGKQAPIQFYQGEDIVLEFYLEYEGDVVLPADWKISAIIKQNPYTTDIVWTGELNNGVYTESSKPGYYKVIVASDVMSNLPSGTYWLDIMIHEISGDDIKDLNVLVLRQPFGFDYSAASPHTVAEKSINESYPPHVNITKL
jgi:hypothetical protein